MIFFPASAGVALFECLNLLIRGSLGRAQLGEPNRCKNAHCIEKQARRERGIELVDGAHPDSMQTQGTEEVYSV